MNIFHKQIHLVHQNITATYSIKPPLVQIRTLAYMNTKNCRIKAGVSCVKHKSYVFDRHLNRELLFKQYCASVKRLIVCMPMHRTSMLHVGMYVYTRSNRRIIDSHSAAAMFVCVCVEIEGRKAGCSSRIITNNHQTRHNTHLPHKTLRATKHCMGMSWLGNWVCATELFFSRELIHTLVCSTAYQISHAVQDGFGYRFREWNASRRAI